MPDTSLTGIPGIGAIEWGKHICHFYRSRQDVVASIVPYIAAGLRNHERCIFGAGLPLYTEQLRAALSKVVPDLKVRENRNQLTLFDHHEWYVHNKSKDPIHDLLSIEENALNDGYRGLRCGGIISWITRKDWKSFFAYEANVNKAVQGRRIMAICCYDVGQCVGEEVFSAIKTHHYAVSKQDKAWRLFETTLRV